MFNALQLRVKMYGPMPYHLVDHCPPSNKSKLESTSQPPEHFCISATPWCLCERQRLLAHMGHSSDMSKCPAYGTHLLLTRHITVRGGQRFVPPRLPQLPDITRSFLHLRYHTLVGYRRHPAPWKCLKHVLVFECLGRIRIH